MGRRLKRTKIRLDWIEVLESPREEMGDIRKLAASIKGNGLREPLLVGKDSYVLFSGYRRLQALEINNASHADVWVAENLVDACNLVRDHLQAETSLHFLPMNIREKVKMGIRLRMLPSPDGSGREFDRRDYVASSIGLQSRVYMRLLSVFEKAVESEMNPTCEMVRARKILALILSAIDDPIPDHSVRQVVERLYSRLCEGDIPLTVSEVFPAPEPFPEEPPPVVPSQLVRSRRVNGRFIHVKPVVPDVRRALDALSGVCAGLSALPVVGPFDASESKFLVGEFRKIRTIIRQTENRIQEAGND